MVNGKGGREEREGTIERAFAISQRGASTKTNHLFSFGNDMNKPYRSHVNMTLLPIEEMFRNLHIKFFDKYCLGKACV